MKYGFYTNVSTQLFIDIKKGTTLIFMNKDNANHSITESGSAFRVEK